MRRFSRPFVPVVLAGLLLTVVPARAESTPEARQWLEKLAGVFKKGPFSLDYTATVHATHEGQTVDATINGHMVQADPKRFKMDMSMETTFPGADKPFKVNMLGIADGTAMWTEMENPMMGGLQVMKLPLDKIDELSKSNPMAANMGHMDPVSQIERMANAFDFAVVDTTADKVTLRAGVTPEGLAEMGKDLPPDTPEQFKTMTLVLDRDTGFPSEMRLGGDEPVFSMHFTNVKLLGAGAVEAETFHYEPPEGAHVIDLGAMMTAKPQGGQ